MSSTIRLAVRQLFKNPGFTVIAVVTLAAGIGLNTAMFSLANGLILLPQPYPNAGELARIWRATPDNGNGGFSPADFVDLQRDGTEFGRFGGFHLANLAPSEAGTGVEWMRVTSPLFEMLGVVPLRGRLFRPEESEGDHRVVILSQGYWQDRFGSDPGVIGKTILGNGDAYEIVGVLPDWATDHRLFGRAALFSPLDLGTTARTNRAGQWIQVLARRQSSLTAAQGQAVINSLGDRAAANYPKENDQAKWRMEGLPESTVSPTGRQLVFMLLGLSGMVLLIACSNLAHLLLARTLERAREFAVRGALGASRSQVLKPLLVEASLLTVAGGGAALFVAMGTTQWLRSVIEGGGGPSFRFPLDWRVMVFASVSCFGTLISFALAPGLFATRIRVAETLKTGGRGASNHAGHHRFRRGLIGAQFALTLILLAGAGAFMQGTLTLMHQNFGWNADRVMQAEFHLNPGRHPGGDEILAFHRQMLDEVAALPDVHAASISYGLPYLGLRGSASYIAESSNEQEDSGSGTSAKVNAVSPDYFEVTGTQLLAGRHFTSSDGPKSPSVVLVSESFARRVFPGQDPLGHRIAIVGVDPRTWSEIVGVVTDVRPIDVARAPAPFQVYQTISQDPRHSAVLAVRAGGSDLGTLSASVRAALKRLDPELELRDLSTAHDLLRRITSQMDFCRQLLTGFAALGLGLATLGIYGVMSRSVSQRTGEIGIRMALGAQVQDVIRMILSSGLRVVLLGAVFGLVGGYGLLRFVSSMLPGLETNGTSILGVSVTVVALIALAACYPPARRASRVDPMTALRAE
ncbi:MAG: ABC transporter permease [Verrucomicrobiales bacterium]|nr:ABC transporter permease [Verrucomicrobiales bacterium]